MATRDFAVDVAVYQSTSMNAYKHAGARQVIVKLTEGTGYFNPKASAQIKSTHANHMYLHAYHFATFSDSVSRAKKEAKYFVAEAKRHNISKKRYLWLDWETGDGNSVIGSKVANTRAILAFMRVCHNAGYKVGLYSSASIFRQYVDTAEVIKKHGTCLWVASYAISGRIDSPDFDYFPSMDGVAMWQFTDNWHGLNVDGNISLIDLHTDGAKKEATKKPVEKPKPINKTGIVYAPVINHNPNWKIRLLDSDGHYTKYIKTNTRWKYFDVKTIKGMKCYKLGTDTQWVPAKYTKIIE
ncbi:GH25 family lysozyme [Lactobacillus helveticus]|uniref:Muramidase n=1 Tax=Lactobacillus helveticus CIRM-BIA 951 TaxID=1226334 RepID=U6F5V1_LACHE|nr:GH25 family lysozyme [Lactobacillus helveticus]MDY0990887.1 GH25 family lysozyme [Lactobacillus helveticus]MDY1001614.1 GH25 family lysozyme [Lactobacillus helveticus]MEB2873408.1 GH25 family lysozyme [Lactobacillus helveticus]CDI58613.1 Muramidase [Lactobacillus helveticus CIRM-BIA 951]